MQNSPYYFQECGVTHMQDNNIAFAFFERLIME